MPLKKKSSKPAPKKSAKNAKASNKRSAPQLKSKSNRKGSAARKGAKSIRKAAAPPKVSQKTTLATTPSTTQGSVSKFQSTYQVQPAYLDPNNVTSTVPFFLPPTLLQQTSTSYGTAVEVDISNVIGPTTGSSCSIGGSDFTLKWNASVAQVIIPAYAWNADAKSRANLRTAFDAFYQSLENLETSQCLTRGGAYAVAQRVAEALPVPLAESLYYRYGFDSSNGCIDLQPGMRLRVEAGIYEFISSSSQLNGFVPGATSYYDICGYLDSDGNQRLAFDAFLGANRAPQIPATSGLAAGIIDFQGSLFPRRYYRLFYPTNLSSGAQGSPSLANNVALIGANTLADMSTATKAYLNNQSCGYNGKNSVLCNLFRGRAIAIPEILVYVSGQTMVGQNASGQPISCLPTYVPIGTTVRNLVERRFDWVFALANPLSQLVLLRQYRQISTNAPPASGQQSNRVNYNSVQFNGQTSTAPGLDVYDLPLLKGDVLMYNASN